jgi:hypothetical protein
LHAQITRITQQLGNDYSCPGLYLDTCTGELTETQLAHQARAAHCARDFVNFREKKSCIARALRGRARLTVYPPWIQIRDVELYTVTKSEF